MEQYSERMNFANDVFTRFVGAVVDVAEVSPEQVVLEARLIEDLNMDSLSVLEILEIMQEALDIDLPTERFDGVNTVGDVYDVLLEMQNTLPS